MKRVGGWYGSIGLVLLLLPGLAKDAGGSVTFSSSLSVSEGYNDNLFFTETDPQSDFTTMINPGFTLTYDTKDLVLSGRYLGSAEFYARRREENKYGQTASFDLNIPFLSRQIKGVEVQVKENISYTPGLPAYSLIGDTPDNQAEVTNDGIQTGRTNTLRNDAGLTIGYTWSPRLNSALSYLNIITRYQEASLQDSIANDINLEGGYQWTPRTRWTASYGTSILKYEEMERFVVYRLTAGANHQISPTLSVNGNAGIASLQGGPTRFTMTAGLSKAFESSSLFLQYNRSIGRGGGLTATPTLSQRVNCLATRRIREGASIYLQFAYGRDTTLSGEELEISSYEARVGATIDLLSWLTGSLSYSYLNQQADDEAGRSGERNLITITLMAKGPSWRIFE